MNEDMRVVKVESDKAILEPLELGKCETCPFNSACGVDPEKNRIVVKTSIRLVPGDVVEVKTPKAVATRLSFFVYTLPLLIFITLLVILKSFGFSDEFSFVLSIIPVALYYVFLKGLDKKLAEKYSPKIVKVKRKFILD